jgi:hypothetical protein
LRLYTRMNASCCCASSRLKSEMSGDPTALDESLVALLRLWLVSATSVA